MSTLYKINVSGRIFSLISIQSLMIIISPIAPIIAFIISDFSNETVYNNSHTSKPLFYKISGTWGNHEGSLLLWLLVLSIFLLIFTITSKSLSNKYRILTVFEQEIIRGGGGGGRRGTAKRGKRGRPSPNEGTGTKP
jgi:Cytochrome c biogenesis factor